MTSTSPRTGTATVLVLVTIFLVSMNMRGTITAVGPLIEQIATDTGYSLTLLGVLASIPMFMWGIISPFVHALTVRFGLNATMGWALAVLGAATVLRSVALPGEVGLWVGTVLIGAALAVINVLMPVATRRDFGAKSSTVMSFNTNMLVIIAAASSGLVVPLSYLPLGDGVLGWRLALMATGVLIPFGLILWLTTHRARRAGRERVDAAEATGPTASPEVPAAPLMAVAPASVARAVWKDRLAWLIAWYMGLQSMQFFVFSSWWPKIEIDRGLSETTGGLEVMTMQLVGMIATYCLPLINRTVLRDRLPAFITIPGIVAAIGMLAWPELNLLWVMVLGLSSGPMLAIPLILIGDRSRDTSAATAVSGMSQAFGYLFSGFGPIIFGWLHTVTGAWQVPLGMYLVNMIAIGVVGWFIRPGWFVFDGKRQPELRVPAQSS
ncbi:MAG TPA: MFS transporter [Microbacteriaceae bacterium]|nr:MFS transporter [Microbacteriaceae bacterium]